jgi:fimbrial chaperone protein
MKRAAILLALALPLGAQAGSFQVNPIGLTLSAARSTGVVTVTNDGDSPTVVQLEIVAWSQENGQDVYTPIRNLLATPPIFTMAAGAQQTVRVGMMSKPDAKTETAYRLYMQEVPPPKESKDLRVLLRVGIPVFVEPAMTTTPEIHWSARRLSATEISVEAVNEGTAHVQIQNLKLGVGTEAKPLAERTGGYVLPGQHGSWNCTLRVPLAAGEPLTLTADTDRGTLHAQLVPGN